MNLTQISTAIKDREFELETINNSLHDQSHYSRAQLWAYRVRKRTLLKEIKYYKELEKNFSNT